MKTARNSLKGYTYQNYIFTLLLAKMDTEREIVKIVSEATDTNNFDDAYIELSSGKKYRLQIKNYEDVSFKDINVDTESHIVSIKSNNNKYNSTDINIFIVNSNFEISADDSFLGIPAKKEKDIYIVPLSEESVANKIESLYQQESRALQIIQFGYKCTSAGKYEVTIEDLPSIITISTNLSQKTVLIHTVPEYPVGISYIEGKPGIGKSHYVNEIINSYPDAIVYRFWICAQDPELNNRLRYETFIEQIGLLAFQSPRSFSMHELIERLCHINKLIIIDGLDHIENYNPQELNKFLEFFNQIKEEPIRVVLLSRPMKTALSWEKTDLPEWTYDETSLYLAIAHEITDYKTQKELYNITKGYPIISYFLAEHYVKYGELNMDTPIQSIFQYYNELLSDVNTKSLLGVFAANNSFFTVGELEELFGPILFITIREFIDGYPYLFEVKANRVSLVHDSFNTFLRRQEKSSEWIETINRKVTHKLLDGDIEYMSRLSSFHLDNTVLHDMLKLYSDFGMFEKVMCSTVDYNSISALYVQLRRILEANPNILNIYQYYSFALIYQIVTRNDLIGYEGLVFQILRYMNRTGDVENLIFSSDIMWQVYLTCKDQPESIKRYMKKTIYGDSQLNTSYRSINEEIEFFDCLEDKTNALELLNEINVINNNFLRQAELLQKYLVISWIQQNPELPFFNEFKEYVDNNNDILINSALQSAYHFDKFWAENAYTVAKYRLHEIGFFGEKNLCRQGTILSIIKDKAPEGSFDVASAILSFLRLANYENREVDIYNVNYVWSMYAEHKDYSVLTIDTALSIYEKEGLINEECSLEIIRRLMKQSDDGIRHLLASYINLKGVASAKEMVKSGKLFDSDYTIDIFELDFNIIDCIPERFIKKRFMKTIRYYHNTDYVNGSEIRNVLRSKYRTIICNALNILNMKVIDGLDDDTAQVIQEAGIEYVCTKGSDRKKEHIPFQDGYISREDFDFIKSAGISALECSRYADGWYSCLPFVDLYQLFDIEEIRNQYLSIIHRALFARVIQKEYIGNWNDIIGNIPLFLNMYEINTEWKKLFQIMLRFLTFL